MAKGAVAKEEITTKLMEVFPKAFPYEKVVVIPWNENGELVHIKLAMTCSKNLIEQGADVALPGQTKVEFSNDNTPTPAEEVAKQVVSKPMSDEEKKHVETLLKSLGLAD